MQISITNAPVFHTTNLEYKVDEQGLFRPLELIIFEGTEVEVIGEKEGFYRVRLSFYPSKLPLYLPKIFIGNGVPKKRLMPSGDEILERFYSKLGLPYVWGGNCSEGVPEMLSLFPDDSRWLFRGLDCSGLLFEATRGITPRNTSWLKGFGVPVTGDLEPLDMILFEGHVLFVAEGGKTIESCVDDGGVVLHDLEERLDKIQKPLSFRRFSKILRSSSFSKSLS